MNSSLQARLVAVMPALFVVLWSTGFIGARYAMPHAEPFGFLSIRFILCVVLFGGYTLFVSVSWPRGPALVSSLVTGALIHTIYLGAVFWAVKNGFPAGFAGLIVGLQPIVTALFAGAIVGEKVSPRQWLGLAIGLCGVALVLGPKLVTDVGPATGLNAVVVFGGVVAFSLGTVLQKKFGGATDLAAGSLLQYAGALVVSGLIALLFEPLEADFSAEMLFALAWLVLVLSVGAIILLMIMIRAGEVARVASLFYLVPAVTAVMAWFLFGESLTPIQIGGIVVTSAGVALATLRRRRIENVSM